MAFKCMTGLSPEYLSNKFISRGSIIVVEGPVIHKN